MKSAKMNKLPVFFPLNVVKSLRITAQFKDADHRSNTKVLKLKVWV